MTVDLLNSLAIISLAIGQVLLWVFVCLRMGRRDER